MCTRNTHTHIHTYTHTHTHMPIHTCLCTHTYTHAYAHTHTYTHAYTHTHTHTYTCTICHCISLEVTSLSDVRSIREEELASLREKLKVLEGQLETQHANRDTLRPMLVQCYRREQKYLDSKKRRAEEDVLQAQLMVGHGDQSHVGVVCVCMCVVCVCVHVCGACARVWCVCACVWCVYMCATVNVTFFLIFSVKRSGRRGLRLLIPLG